MHTLLIKFGLQKRAGLVAFLLSLGIIICTSLLARITLHLQSASIISADTILQTYLNEDDVKNTTLLRNKADERHYLVETADDQQLVILKKTDAWHVESTESLRE